MKMKNIRKVTFFLAMILLTGPILSLFNSISYGLEIEEINKEINSEHKAIDRGVDNLNEVVEEEKIEEKDIYEKLKEKDQDEPNSNQDKVDDEGNSFKNKEENIKLENDITDVSNKRSLKKDSLLVEAEVCQIQFAKIINGDEVFKIDIDSKEIKLEEDYTFIEVIQNITSEDDISIYNDDIGHTYKLDNIEIVFKDIYDKINLEIDDKMIDESIFSKFVQENKFTKEDGKTYLNLKNIDKIEIEYIEEIEENNNVVNVKDFNELKQAIDNDKIEEIIIDNNIMLEETIEIDRPITILGSTNDKVSLVTENKMEGRHIIITENAQVVIKNLIFLNTNEYKEEEHRKKIEVGGIENKGSLKLSNVEIKGNIFNYGGGLYSSGYIELEDVIFNNNYARGMGGAICNIGEINFIGNTLFNNNGYIFINDNKLQTPYGGAIYTEESLIVKEDIDLSFIQNESNLNGGALYSNKFFNKNNNIIEIDIMGNVLFKENKSLDGGAISGENIILKGKNEANIEFVNNKAFIGAATSNISMDIVDNSYLELSNNETIAGGTIYNDVGNINIKSTKGALFNNNKIKDLDKENYIENQVEVIKEIINDVNYIYDAQNLEGNNNYRSLEYLKDLMLYEFPITKYPLSEDLREQIFKDELEAEECREKKNKHVKAIRDILENEVVFSAEFNNILKKLSSIENDMTSYNYLSEVINLVNDENNRRVINDEFKKIENIERRINKELIDVNNSRYLSKIRDSIRHGEDSGEITDERITMMKLILKTYEYQIEFIREKTEDIKVRLYRLLYLNETLDKLVENQNEELQGVDFITSIYNKNYFENCTFNNKSGKTNIVIKGLLPEEPYDLGKLKIKNSSIDSNSSFFSIDQSAIDSITYNMNKRYLIDIDTSIFKDIKSLISMNIPEFETLDIENIEYDKLEKNINIMDLKVKNTCFEGENLQINLNQNYSRLPLYLKMSYINNTFDINDSITFNNDVIKEVHNIINNNNYINKIINIYGNDVEFTHNTLITSKLENYHNTIFENNLILSDEEKNAEFIEYLGQGIEDQDIGKYYNNMEIDKNQEKKVNNEYKDVFNLYQDKNSKILEEDSSNQIYVGSFGNESKLVHYKVINEDIYGSFDKISDIDSDTYGKLRPNKVTPGSVEAEKMDGYIVEFITDGGSEVKEQKILKGNLVIEPKDPKKDGYKFKYWENSEKEKFDFDTIISNNIKLYAKWEKIDDTDIGIIEGDSNDPEIQTEYIETVTYIYDKNDPILTLYYEDIPGSNDYNKFIVKKGEKIKEPRKDGYNLLGWSTYKDGNEIFSTEDVQKIANRLSKNTSYYAIWEDSKLNKKEHIEYLDGYLDKTIRPEQNISREEVSAVFYRLLTEDYKQSIYSLDNNFIDLSSERWSNKHISTLANGNILTGYEDGEFKYENFITRAEVATIASRFEDLDQSNHNFTDVKGHWAEEYIASASKKGWVEGYKDGSFRPDEYITRAEFVTLVNRVLNRGVKKKNILKGIKEFKDLKDNTWYYEEFVEATNGHTFNLDNENDRTSEKWLELKEFNMDM